MPWSEIEQDHHDLHLHEFHIHFPSKFPKTSQLSMKTAHIISQSTDPMYEGFDKPKWWNCWNNLKSGMVYPWVYHILHVQQPSISPPALTNWCRELQMRVSSPCRYHLASGKHPHWRVSESGVCHGITTLPKNGSLNADNWWLTEIIDDLGWLSSGFRDTHGQAVFRQPEKWCIMRNLRCPTSIYNYEWSGAMAQIQKAETVNAGTYNCMCIYIYVCMSICICICIYIFIHSHI